jgi:hypothetical protein
MNSHAATPNSATLTTSSGNCHRSRNRPHCAGGAAGFARPAELDRVPAR